MAYLIPVCPNAPRRRNHQSNILLRSLFHVSGIPHQVYELRAFVHDLVYVQTDLLPHFLRTVAVPEHVACCFLRNYHTPHRCYPVLSSDGKRLAFVGRMFGHARHGKLRILLGTLSCQVNFQNFFMHVAFELSSAPWLVLSSHASLYADFTVNFPEEVRAQMRRSSGKVGLSAMARTDSTSLGMRVFWSASESHSPLWSLISVATSESLPTVGHGVTTL